ncbi:transmembrane amino acid transporter protein-domain-containing protein [Lophiotrema nucula]|uniref:Transmembrane amino acid transporter protein-domain-containing protein n=1 Tax=Lophiotrema nucula TaxID=690887 RepID=A0A6A5YGH3_9PLEO|nr:transmembrane amino acid transporter protein-domain-containing protein [Lophiotrema nucula]
MEPTTEEKRGRAPARPGSPPDQSLSTYIKPQYRRPHDPDVTFEEYYYYAQKTREEELTLEAPKIQWKEFLSRKKKTHTDVDAPNASPGKNVGTIVGDGRLEISDEEWTNASRLFRTASTGACFYLITTDILGPYGIGFALGTLGWGPGIALFTVFGFMAGYSGYLIRHVYLGLDSYQFPIRNYGDLGFRTWGTTARYVTNIMQALGLLLILGQVTIQYGLNISQVSRFRLCYAVCPVVFVCVGFFLTQIRTLKAYGWVANFAVWLNLLAIFISMGVIANSAPNYAISVLGSAGSAVDKTTITPNDAGEYPPVMHYAKLPVNSLVGSINGLLQGVLAYAGAQLFVEFLAEMRRPRDFIKAMWGAQFFIYSVYLIYGCFVYHYQGQYSFQPSYQGVSVYGWQTVGNMITLIAALIAAGLYGNIGIKVLYNNILVDIFHAPLLVTTKGKWIYACIVPIWWAVAFVIAAAIPDYFGFVAVISASMLLNLTYTLPPFFAFGFDVQMNAIRAHEGEGFDPTTGRVKRTESTVTRWRRGFVSGGPLVVARNVWHIIYFFASLSMCGLGMYAAIEGMIEAFKNPQLNSFSCTSPLDLSAMKG